MHIQMRYELNGVHLGDLNRDMFITPTKRTFYKDTLLMNSDGELNELFAGEFIELSQDEYDELTAEWRWSHPQSKFGDVALKYSEMQPRARDGKWTSALGMPTGWKQLDDLSPDVQKAAMATMLGKCREKYRYMAKDDPKGAEESAKALAEDFRNEYLKHAEQFAAYKHGKTVLEVDRSIPDHEKVAAEYAKQIDALNAEYPISRPRVLVVNDVLLNDPSCSGYTSNWNSSIVISPRQAKVGYRMMEAEGRLDHHMPAANIDNMGEYVLAHEWGHAFDNHHFKVMEEVGNEVRAANLKDKLSVYGASDYNERTAEVFAQMWMESKHPDLPTSPITAVVKPVFDKYAKEAFDTEWQG